VSRKIKISSGKPPPPKKDGLQGVDSLRGIAMEWADILDGAGVWAAALGIEILDPDTPAGD
jgi:hypothetical protein